MQMMVMSTLAFLLILNGIIMIAAEIKWSGIMKKMEKRRIEAQDRKYKASYPKEFLAVRREWERYLSRYEQQK